MKISIEDFTGECSCGQTHELAVNDVILEEGALQKIPQILKQEPYDAYHHLAMVCDGHTYEAAGREIERLLDGIPVVKLNPEGLHADEIGVGKVKEQMGRLEGIDCLLAVGSGTIHDLTRYYAYQTGIPFISIPTAASVDGYVSTVAAMSWYGFKRSMIAKSPILVIADSRVIAEAPMRLTASGVGDLLGKNTALADWKITHILNGEHICRRICDMEYEALNNLKKSLPGLVNGEIAAYEELMYGLLLSGLAMQMTGHSRPASGAEHHMAHFWEMAVINEETEAYHGEKVGVGLMLAASIYHAAAERMKTGNFHLKKSVPVETELIETTFRNPELCRRIKETNEPNLLDTISPDVLRKKNDEIIRLIEEIPTPEEIRSLLRTAGGVCTLEELGFPPEMKADTARTAPYIRDRITFLRILKYYDFYEDVIR